ncbi:MAG: hypothetical protein RMM58_10465 [Chloroflexota bacterium]|nr:hypothetical protein [Chloroflexota bacterium]
MIAQFARRLDRGMAVAALLSLLAAVPLLDGRVAGGEAAERSLAALIAFDRALREGTLWSRWADETPSGVPLFTAPPLAYALAEGGVLLGIGYWGALKAAMIIAVVAAAVAMYLLGRRLYGSVSGVVAAVVFVYLPVYLFAVYERAALSEVVAFVWLPLIPWSLLQLEPAARGRPRSRWGAVGAVAVAGGVLGAGMLTDPLLVALVLPVAAALVAWRAVEEGAPRRAVGSMLGRAGAALALAAGIAAVWWLPLIASLPPSRQPGPAAAAVNSPALFVHPVQLVAPYRDVRAAGGESAPALGVQLGIAALGLGGFALVGSPLSIPRRARRTATVFAAAAAALAALATPLAAPLWAALPGAMLMEIPWRALEAAALALAALAGAAAAGLEERFGDPLAAVRAVVPLLVAAVLASWMLLRLETGPVQPGAGSPREGAKAAFSSLPAEQGQRSSASPQGQLGEPLTSRSTKTGDAQRRLPDSSGARDEAADHPGLTVQAGGPAADHLRLTRVEARAAGVPPDEGEMSRFDGKPVRPAAGAATPFAAALTAVLLGTRGQHGS